MGPLIRQKQIVILCYFRFLNQCQTEYYWSSTHLHHPSLWSVNRDHGCTVQHESNLVVRVVRHSKFLDTHAGKQFSIFCLHDVYNPVS